MHKKSKSKRTEWSEWEYDQEHQQHYRYRIDRHGQPQYEWAPLTTEATPRESASQVDAIAQGMNNIRFDNNPQIERGTAAYGSESHETGGSEGHPEDAYKLSTDTYPSSSGQFYHQSTSDAASQYYQQNAPDAADQYHDQSTSDAANQYYQQDTPDAADQHYHQNAPDAANQYQYYRQNTTDQGYAEPATTSYSYDSQRSDNEDEQDADLQHAINESRNVYSHPYGSQGESSAMGGATAAYDEAYEDEGPPTPTQRVEDYNYNTVPDLEDEMEERGELDPRYRVMHSDAFQPGEIFKVHWAEPKGAGPDANVPAAERQEYQNKYGTKFYFGFRRFVVVAGDQGHCTCVPISTYGGKACKKKGIKANKHGIIYQAGHRPKLLDGEPKLGFPPVKVHMIEDTEKLSKESRVNYSKLVTIEHNVRVFFIGRVDPKHMQSVEDAVDSCWQAKSHPSRAHRR